MQTYAKYAPTGFDDQGAFLKDRQEWLVVPVGRNRDSGVAQESNWDATLKILCGESDDVEIHRFGHWGPGWFEIIIVRPGSKAQDDAEDIERGLEDCPYLDDDDVSKRELNEFLSDWSDYGAHDFSRAVAKTFEMTDEQVDALAELGDDKLREFYCDRANCIYEHESDGIFIPVRSMAERMTDVQLKDLMTLAAGGSRKENPNQLKLQLEAAE